MAPDAGADFVFGMGVALESDEPRQQQQNQQMKG